MYRSLFIMFSILLLPSIKGVAQSPNKICIFNVYSNVDSGAVYWNDKFVGYTPLKKNRHTFDPRKEPAHHILEVRKKGYETAKMEFKKAPDTRYKYVTLELERPRYKLPEGVNIQAPQIGELIHKINQGDKIGIIEGAGFVTPKSLILNDFFALAPSEYQGIIKDEFDNSSFTVSSDAEDLFKKRSITQTSNYKLGGIIKEIHAVQGYESNSCKITIEWSLFDTRREKVVYTKSIEGYAKLGSLNIVFYKSIRDAVIMLMWEEEFINTLKESKSAGEDEFNPETQIDKINPPVAKDYAQLIDKVLPGVVTVSIGDVSHGSGFIISEDGLLITNHHVVTGNEKVTVIGSNKVSLPAEVIAINPEYDLALVKVVGSGYKPLALGNSADVKLGTEVTAIGTPRYTELNQTVTKGIVSGLRVIEGKEYIQTDVSVSPGNSGGPLINDKGEVVGIVAWKIGGGTYEGLSFAIPIRTALEKLNVKTVE